VNASSLYRATWDATVTAHAAGILKPRSILNDTREIRTLVVEGDPLAPRVTAERRTFATRMKPQRPVSVRLPAAVARLPRLAAQWFVAFPVVPGTVKADDRVIRAVVVVDEATGRLLTIRAVRGTDIEAAARKLFDVFSGANADDARGLPGEIVFTNSVLFDAIGPGLMQAGVRVGLDQSVPMIDDPVAGMQAHMRGDA
jgi:hypothetical protein